MKTYNRRRFIGPSLVLLWLIAGCGDAKDWTAVSAEDLLEQGPDGVGYREYSLTYRPDGWQEDRTLELEVWYPAVPATGEPTTYSVAGFIDVEREGPRTDADPVPDGDFPVLIYSHGNHGVGLVGFSYGEYFASWGWIVVAPDHTGNTIIDRGNPVAFDNLTRPQDVSAVLDWLESGVPAPLAGRVGSDVLVVGHSFGAYSALSVAGALRDWSDAESTCEALDDGSCEVYGDPVVMAALEAGFFDERVDAIVPQAGASTSYLDGELAALDVPTLWMTARLDITVTWEEHGAPGWAALDGPDDVWVDLVRGAHHSFHAACEAVDPAILESAGQNVLEDGCGEEFTPIAESVPVVMAYIHAFARDRLFGESIWGAVLRGPVFHPEVEVTTR